MPVPVELPSNNLADLAYPDIQAYLKVCDLVMVPMASTEQHGPHLPLSTDTVTAYEVASRVAKINNMLHTPAIWTGYSPQHMAGPGEGRGTITIRSSTLQALMYDVARSLIHHGFNKILFINGHGSNVKVVDPVLRKIRYDTGAMVGFCIPYMERYTGLLEGLMENPKDETPGWHASELETSQMLAHNPDIVRMDRAVKTREPQATSPRVKVDADAGATVVVGQHGALLLLDPQAECDSLIERQKLILIRAVEPVARLRLFDASHDAKRGRQGEEVFVCAEPICLRDRHDLLEKPTRPRIAAGGRAGRTRRAMPRDFRAEIAV